MHRRIHIVVGLLLVIGVAIGLRARLSEAHADYDRSTPAAEAEIAVAPVFVEVFFTQEIDSSGTVLRVLGPDASVVDLGDTQLDLFDPDRKRVTVSLLPNLPPGRYTVEWTSFSGEDGEADSGRFTFTILGIDGGTPAASPVASPMASPAATPTT